MVPPGSDDVVTLSVGALTAMLRTAGVAACVGVCKSVTVTVKPMGPVTSPVGVPLMTPVLLFKLNPAGKVPGGTLHV
jgi:ABC-type transport system involved in cytochrome c biogenesis permease component